MPKVVVNNMPTDDEIDKEQDALEEILDGQMEIPLPPIPDDDNPEDNWVLSVSEEETKALMDYMTSLNQLISNQPIKRNPPTKKWISWNEKVKKLNEQYQKELLDFAMSCANISGVLDEDYPSLISNHLSTKNLDSEHIPDSDNKPEHLERIAKKADKYVMPNTNLATSMPGRYDPNTDELIPIVGAGPFDLPALSRPHQITNYTVVTLDENITISSKVPFTSQDLCNLNAVCSLYEAGNRIITPEMVHRTKANQIDTEYTKPQTLAEEAESLEKMRHIFIRCDMSSEFMQRNKEREKRGLKPLTLNGKRPNKYEISDYMLNMREETVQAGDTSVSGYYLEAEPILLEHAKKINQLITVPIKMLDIKTVKNGELSTVSVPNTSTRQPIKEYLLRRIQIMKRDTKNKKSSQSHIILFDTLYRESGVKKENKTETKRARDYAFQCLDFWVAVGYISNYTINKHGSQIYSIEIFLNTR